MNSRKQFKNTFIRFINANIYQLRVDEYIVYAQHYIILKNKTNNTSTAYPHNQIGYIKYEDSNE